MKNGGIRATVLGSGTCVPRKRRASSCVWVRTGESQVLFDTGVGAMRRLVEAGGSIADITHLCYSHLHPDHTAEFAPFIFATKYPPHRARQNSFTVVAGRGFEEFHQALESAWGDWVMPHKGIMKLKEVSVRRPERVEFPDFSLTTFPMEHTVQSVGFRLQTPDGRVLAYTGDTDECEHLLELAKDADLFFCECSTPDGLKTEGHLTPSLAGRAAAKAGARHLILYHLYPECDQIDPAAQAAAAFDGRITVAEDLMEFAV
ncbi:MAG: ribonuclease Z [Deltaproteobacteria bacterium]|nr:ribonuclease Z [Deltaproteobacteria bacterium]